MTSDKNDDLDLEMDMGTPRDDNDTVGNIGDDMDNDNIIDVEGIDEPLSASPFSASANNDFDDADIGDDDFGGDDDQPPADYPARKKSGGMTKVVAPLLVLLAAGAAGGYIVMNPGILGGVQTQMQMTPQAEPQPPVADTAMLPPPDLTPELPTDMPPVEMASGDVPPQPLATLNEAPDQGPDQALDQAVDQPVDQAMPEILPETTAADPNAPVEDTAQVLAGSDVAVTPESLQVTPEMPVADAAPAADAPAPAPVELAAASMTPPPVMEATPEVMPETAPPVEAAANTPVNTPVAADAPVAPPAGTVTQPTFVPAPPVSDSTVPVEVTNPAAPPVMNAQELAPVTDPATKPATSNANALAAASGQVSAPPSGAAPKPAANVYYDSLSQVPTGAMATSVGPREINPVMEPASKMVVVSKDKAENSEASLLVAANRALKLQRYDAALEMYDQLYAKNNRDARILMGRAVAQQNMGLHESAIQSYEDVLALKPDNAEALVNLMGLVRKQYPEVALRRLLDMYARYPNNAGIAAQIGITNAGLGHYDDAMRYLGIASTLEPRNAQHLFNMAIAADRQGNKPMAIQLYERALETDVMYGASRSVPRESIYDRLSVLRRG